MGSMLDMKRFAAELHHRAARHYPRRHVRTGMKNDIWSADLVDMSDFADVNDNMRFLLTVIDLGTRYAWVRPLKNKTGAELRRAMQSIFEEAKSGPKKLWTDQGTEFYNREVQALLKSKKVELYSTFSDTKAAFIERFNRTLKGRMWRYFTEQQTRRWIDHVQTLVKEYNESTHSSIAMTPKAAWEQGYAMEAHPPAEPDVPPKPKFAVGDRVRINRIKGMFEKGYTPNWSVEIFIITSVHPTIPTTYTLKDYRNEVIKGRFYEQELLKTEIPEGVFLVEKVLAERTVRGKRGRNAKQYLVKWWGYDDSWNSWVDAKDIEDLKSQ